MSMIILLAVENRHIHQTLAPLLQAEGFSVLVETDGRWALRVFEKRDVRCVVLGALGGQKGGLELAEKIRRTIKGRTTPLLMISEGPRKASILEAARRAYGLIDVIETPLRPERVLAALRRALGDGYPSARQAAADRARLAGLRAERFAGPDSERERSEVEEHSGRFRLAPRHGSLAETPLPELLGQLYAERASGGLLLSRGRVKKLVSLRDGLPAIIRSNRLEECLGRFLVRARVISEQECAASLDKMKASGRQQGTVLVAMGCISPSSLRRALQLQLQMKLFDPFGWPDGSYRFDPSARPPAAPLPLDLSAANVIHQGIRRKLSPERIEARLTAELELAARPHPDPLLRFQPLELAEAEQALLARLLSGRRLAQLLAEAGAEREALLRLAYTLKCTRMAEFVEPPPAAEALSIGDEPTTNAAEAPPAVAGRELTRVRRGLAQELAQARQQDHFARLALPRGADRQQVEEAFRMLARRFHPDHATQLGSTQIRRLNAEMFELICEAHQVLSDDGLRQAYLERIAPPPEPKSKLADKTIRAEALFAKGQRAMRRREYDYARAMFEQAVRLYPDEAEYRAELGLAMFRAAPDDSAVVRLARDELNQSISLSPVLHKAHLYLGWIYRRMGQRELSIHEFEQALVCDPKCIEAARELKLLQSRRRPAKKGLGRLLDKWKKAPADRRRR